jgi:hypothetical protein
MGVVRKTSFHVRVLLSHISPALPALFALTGKRIAAAIGEEFPQDEGGEWTVMKPSKAVVRCVSESIALVLFGEEMTARNPELVNLAHEHTNNGEWLEKVDLPIIRSYLTSEMNSFPGLLCHALRAGPPAAGACVASPAKVEVAQGLEQADELRRSQGAAAQARVHREWPWQEGQPGCAFVDGGSRTKRNGA